MFETKTTNRMRITRIIVALVIIGTMCLCGIILSARNANCAEPPPRVKWLDSKVIGSPEPPPMFRLRRVFPDVAFQNPLFLINVPTTERLLVIQRDGKIFQLEMGSTKPELYFDVGRETYSLCFHPNHADNGYIYVFSHGTFEDEQQNRIARYTISKDNGRPDPASEKVILQYGSGGHNGHHLLFGPDKKLYISSGDGTVGMDPKRDGQNMSTLRGKILRIDVDHTNGDSAYSVPPNNPFVSHKDVKPEIFALGMRNPFRMAFDPRTEKLWVADIGQDSWEMVYLVEAGANCGWSIQEGSHPLIPDQTRGPTPIVPPIIEHPHSEMRSITGGYFYQGKQFPELQGAYLYGDYDTGKLFGARYDYAKHELAWQRELADTTIRILSIGEDRNGEPLIVDFAEGGIFTIERVPADFPQPPFPKKLSETGIFTDVSKQVVHPAIVPYDVNSPLWSDGARKQRYLGLPGESQIEFTSEKDWRAWKFPMGTVLVKSFSLEMEAGNAQSLRQIETRLLTLQVGPAGGEWVGYSYRWNDDQTDAELVEKSGIDVTYSIRDAAEASGTRKHKWHFPSRAECMTCHTRESRYVLGVTTLQMNRDFPYQHGTQNQIAAFEQWGLFKNSLEKRPSDLPAMVNPYDESQPIERRARSYLHANCAHCHVSNGGGNSDLVIDYLTPLENAQLVNVVPQHKGIGDAKMRLLTPGVPENSLIWQRLKLRGRGQMPPLATTQVDEPTVQLFRNWIRELKESDK